MKIEKQYLLIKNINRLLKKGYSLMETFEILKHVESKKFIRINKLLDEGESLSSIFKKLKFKKFAYEAIQVGEQSNKLNEIISLIEKQFDFFIKFKKQFNKVLLYPIMVLIFALGCFEMIKINLYPIIQNILDDYLIVQNQYFVFIAFNLLKIFVGLLFSFWLILNLSKPLGNLSPSIKMFRTLYFIKHLEVLITCGNSLEESLIILQNSFNQKVYKFKDLKKALLYDENIKCLSPYHHSFISYFKLGMRSNDLIGTLQDYVYIFDEILFEHINKITYYVQFILFSLLSLNIFLIYYIVMIPMLQISNKI